MEPTMSKPMNQNNDPNTMSNTITTPYRGFHAANPQAFFATTPKAEMYRDGKEY